MAPFPSPAGRVRPLLAVTVPRRACVSSSRERGQAAVLIALGMFTLVIFTALATNMGILVNERIRIQNTADLAAYSGAYQQATRMNAMAGLNRAIQGVVHYCRARLTSGGGKFSFGPVKIWNQCLPEGRPPSLNEYDEYEMFPFELMAQIGAAPPVHRLYPPPYAMTGFPIPSEDQQCLSDYDHRANELIMWCADTINYYGQLLYDLNDYDAAYFGTGGGGSIMGASRKAIFKAVQNTARANYPNASVEMLDAPRISPVNRGRFVQDGVNPVILNPGGGEFLYSEPSYDRPVDDRPSMVPISKYETPFNYMFRCCRINQRTSPCGPPQCGFPRGVVLPYIGPANYYYGGEDGPAPTFVSVSSVASFDIIRGSLFMPVRVSADPNRHNLPMLDLSGRQENYFGGFNGWRAMRATAVAKPFEGFIGPFERMMDNAGVNDQFIPPIVSTGSQIEGRPWPTWPDGGKIGIFGDEGLATLKDEGEYGYDTYRARVAGFRDSLFSRQSNMPMGQQLLNVLIEHAQAKPIEGDQQGADYQHTSH